MKTKRSVIAFFEDLCTSPELKAMSQRLVVAKMLTEKKVYSEIVKETGASTATISRVKRALFDNDTYGYTLVLDKNRQRGKTNELQYFFAYYYDVLMQNVGYKERSDYICELMKRHNHEFGITLDLACGTGSLTTELALKGIDVYGIDASAEMLSEAMQKSSEKGLNILYLRQKMQSLNLYGTIDTCICTLDSINHITNEKDVAKAFERVAFFMNQDGLFVFDVNTVYKHEQVLANNTFVYETDKVFLRVAEYFTGKTA